MNVNGLCATKKIVTESKNLIVKQLIRDAIKQDAIILIQHIYGNYIIQTALDHWDIQLLLPITEEFCGNFQHLSTQNYSSNVLEKCFERLKDLILVPFIVETSMNLGVVDLMKHSYGNYVIQKAIKLSDGNNKKNYISLISKNINKLQDKKLIYKWFSIIDTANIETEEAHSLKMANILSTSVKSKRKAMNKCQ